MRDVNALYFKIRQLFKTSLLSTKLNADHQPYVTGLYIVDDIILLFLLPLEAYCSLGKHTRGILIFSVNQ